MSKSETYIKLYIYFIFSRGTNLSINRPKLSNATVEIKGHTQSQFNLFFPFHTFYDLNRRQFCILYI